MDEGVVGESYPVIQPLEGQVVPPFLEATKTPLL